MKLTFKIGDPCITHLIDSDPLLGKLIETLGDYTLELSDNYYLKLLQSIIGQQLSIKAKETIWNRVIALVEDITPESILSIQDIDLRNAGVSYAKISYIKELSSKVISKDLSFQSIDLLTNEEVISMLTGVKGIGKWTSEMFLIFSLGRVDVMSLDDAGLRRSIKWLYDFQNNPTPTEIKKISEPWKPYRSIASLYLWEAVNTNLILTRTTFI